MAPYYKIGPPPMSPFGRVLASVFAVLVIAGAVLFGLFVLALALGLGMLLWAGLAIRAWWLRRKGIEKPPDSRGGRPEVIDAEYTVISRRREKEPERH